MKDENNEYFMDESIQNLALSLPMVEMAQERIIFVDEILYYDNKNIKLDEEQVQDDQEIRVESKLRSRPKY